MRFKLFRYQSAVAVAVTICALSASAEAPTGAICAVQQAVACGAFEACERALPAAVNLPPLMRFDVGAGIIESRHENGAIRTSKIASSSTEGEALVLQGLDGGHPWAIRVNTKNGGFTLTVLREGEGFLGFGECSANLLDALGAGDAR
jgi:hypothetical protein